VSSAVESIMATPALPTLAPEPDFRLLFESLPGLHLIFDPGLMIVAVGDMYLQAARTTREEIKGRYVSDVFPDLPGLRASLERVRRTKLPDITPLDRSRQAINTPICRDGRLIYILHRIEDAPRGQWTGQALRSVGEAVIAADAEGRILLMNPAAEELTGCPETQAIGSHIDDIVAFVEDAGEPQNRVPWRQPLAPSGIERDTLAMVRPTGECVPVVRCTSRLESEDGSIAGSVLLLRDISALKRTEEQLRQTNHELHQFVRSVSHDLQEPLRMISLYSEMVQQKLAGLDPDSREYLHFIIGGAGRMAALLADLRAYAEITSTHTSTAANETDANLVLQMALANLTVAISESGASVVHDPLPRVRVEQAHLLQLFQNLISNAIKYRRDEAPLIRISANRAAEQWELSFTDNGAGIRPQFVGRIFDFFQRFHNTDVPGTGMGLALCQRIVHRYGGRIWVDSTPGIGSTFHLTLPAACSPAN